MSTNIKIQISYLWYQIIRWKTSISGVNFTNIFAQLFHGNKLRTFFCNWRLAKFKQIWQTEHYFGKFHLNSGANFKAECLSNWMAIFFTKCCAPMTLHLPHKVWWNQPQVSISSTFYIHAAFARAEPKSIKKTVKSSVFLRKSFA